MVNADYVWITGDAFTDMRLLIEGAIVLYEEDAGDIMRLLRGEKNREVRYLHHVFDDVEGRGIFALGTWVGVIWTSILCYESLKRFRRKH